MNDKNRIDLIKLYDVLDLNILNNVLEVFQTGKEFEKEVNESIIKDKQYLLKHKLNHTLYFDNYYINDDY